jgi:transposase-like protein
MNAFMHPTRQRRPGPLDRLPADVVDRGLRAPVLVVSDGAAGLVSAIEQTFPASLRQRCLIHRVRNLFAKVPTAAQAEVKAAYWQLFDLDLPPGQAAVEEAHRRAEAFAARYQRTYLGRSALPARHPARADRAPAVSR